MTQVEIAGRALGAGHPTYFIADIAANHDGSLERAKELIHLAKESGAEAAKFQHFSAHKIVSASGFGRLGQKVSHQSSWNKSVVEVYEDASVPPEWTPELKAECDRAGITFFSSPYDIEAVDDLDPYVPAFKIGSGDIDWLEEIEHIASKKKPVILATGAAEIGEVQRAVETILAINGQLVLLQCNTNYTADDSNLAYLNLNVLNTYKAMWPDLVLGLSDHTHGPAAVLGAVALGGRVIERHFTDDNDRAGPDHRFALDPSAWRDMVDETRRLELALGRSTKTVAGNEIDTAVVQRRCLRAARDLKGGQLLTRADIDVLRPAIPGAVTPADLGSVLGRSLIRDMTSGEELRWGDMSSD